MTKCSICGRDVAKDELCRYHIDALKNLREVFERWNTASGVSWEEYLETLVQIEETGRWVKDVVEYVNQQGVS